MLFSPWQPGVATSFLPLAGARLQGQGQPCGPVDFRARRVVALSCDNLLFTLWLNIIMSGDPVSLIHFRFLYIQNANASKSVVNRRRNWLTKCKVSPAIRRRQTGACHQWSSIKRPHSSSWSPPDYWRNPLFVDRGRHVFPLLDKLFHYWKAQISFPSIQLHSLTVYIHFILLFPGSRLTFSSVAGLKNVPGCWCSGARIVGFRLS